MREVIDAIDVTVLNAVLTVLHFLRDWLSWSQRWIERALIAGWVLCWWTPDEMRRPVTWWSSLIFVLIFHFLVSLHRAPNADRGRRLLLGAGAGFRIFLIAQTVFILACDLYPPVSRAGLWAMGEQMTWVSAIFVTSLPSGGEPGKKRKAAITKIIDQFGREFVPEGA